MIKLYGKTLIWNNYFYGLLIKKKVELYNLAETYFSYKCPDVQIKY